MDSSTVRRGSNALGWITEGDCLDLAALLVVSVAWPIGRTSTVQPTTLPHLHCSIVWTRRKVRLIVTHTHPAHSTNTREAIQNLRSFCSFATYSPASLDSIDGRPTILVGCRVDIKVQVALDNFGQDVSTRLNSQATLNLVTQMIS